MSAAKVYSAEAARALREASPTKGRWVQAHHVDEPRAIVDETRPMHSMLGLDSDGMAIFNEAADAELACAAGDLTHNVERLIADAARLQGFVDDMRAILAGRPRPPTDDEVRIMQKMGGWWRVVFHDPTGNERPVTYDVVNGLHAIACARDPRLSSMVGTWWALTPNAVLGPWPVPEATP